MNLYDDREVSRLPPSRFPGRATHRQYLLAEGGVGPHPRPVRHRHAPERGHRSPDVQLLFGGAMHAVLLLHNGHGDKLASDIAGFIMKEPQS